MKANIALLLVLILFVSATFATVPSTFSYQGILTDSLGEPVEDDVYAIKFKVHADSIVNSTLWESNGFIPVQTVNGLFHHTLGSTTPLPDSLNYHDNLWVGITVNLDDEMFPRTKLASVPFAFKASWADMAGYSWVSYDKTINADELTEGLLDTARYSAYGDLVSEDKIGEDSDQVPTGDHGHAGASFSGTMVRFEDTTIVSVNIPGAGGWVLLKSIYIPPNEINDFFRITYPLNANPAASIEVRANNQVIFEFFQDATPKIMAINSIRYSANNWLSCVSFYSWGLENNINLAGGLNIEIYGSWGVNAVANVGTLIVEYDVD